LYDLTDEEIETCGGSAGSSAGSRVVSRAMLGAGCFMTRSYFTEHDLLVPREEVIRLHMLTLALSWASKMCVVFPVRFYDPFPLAFPWASSQLSLPLLILNCL